MLTSVTFNGFIYKNGIIIRVKKITVVNVTKGYSGICHQLILYLGLFFFLSHTVISFPSSISKGLDEKSDPAFMEKCEAIRAYTKITLYRRYKAVTPKLIK